jgi:glucosamine-6-phosphate deaminase
MQIHIVENYDEVSKKAAALVMKEMIIKPNLILGLATGSSPIGLYDALIDAYNKELISFKDVKTFNLDEYIGIARTHPQSYFSFMHEHLFKHVDINEKNIHIPNNDINRIDDLAKEYNDLLFGNQRDIQILGIGANGHIGFNEPGSSLSNQTFIVELDETTRKDNARFFGDINLVPKYAITMGIKNIMYSKKIILIASGKHKAEAVYKMAYSDIDTHVPASILQLHPDCVVIVDEDAASMLPTKEKFIEF